MTAPPRLADRIPALVNSIDLSGFAPFASPVMFILNENVWSAMILTAALAASLLVALVVFGWRRGPVQADGTVRLSLSVPGFAGLGWRPSSGIRNPWWR